MRMTTIILLSLIFCSTAYSDPARTNHSGPRVGVVYFSADKIDDVEINHVASLFGWQVEHRYAGGENKISGIVEFIPLVAGVESGLFLPTISVLIGIRFPNGFHLGAGPNISLAGSSIVLGAGYNYQADELNIPLDFAFAVHKQEFRVSFSTGFNLPE